MTEKPNPALPILLVDDEPHILNGFAIGLRTAGLNHIIRCQDARQAMRLLGEQEVEAILLDLMMPHVSGQEILARVRAEQPDVPVIILTGVNDVATAVDCMRQGAFDYLLKPVSGEHLIPAVRRALEVRHLRRENSRLASRILSDRLDRPEAFAAIISRNRQMQAIFHYCEAIAEGQQPVLITGETGVGKELFARALHQAGRSEGPFIAINVAGLDDQVFADTLFGHARGAYTGAERARPGLVEKAAGGTLFLDEIGDLSETSQIKLLRFLEGGEYYPLGADAAKLSTARVLVATSLDLEAAAAEGLFRKDLFFRLRTHQVRIPPLRERQDDLPLLFEHFLREAAAEFRKEPPRVEAGMIHLLSSYSFPGNIRELRALVYDAVGSLRGKLLTREAFASLPDGGSLPVIRPPEDWAVRLHRLPTLKEASVILVDEALRRTDQNQRMAAALLGISPQALNQRLKKK